MRMPRATPPQPTSPSGLVVRGLRKSYGKRTIIRDVSLHLARGEVVGLSLIHISEPTRPY